MKKDNPGTVRSDRKAVKMQMQIVMDMEMGKSEATGGWDGEEGIGKIRRDSGKTDSEKTEKTATNQGAWLIYDGPAVSLVVRLFILKV